MTLGFMENHIYSLHLLHWKINRDQWRVICGSSPRHSVNKAQLITSRQAIWIGLWNGRRMAMISSIDKNLDHSSNKNQTGWSTSGQFWKLPLRGVRSNVFKKNRYWEKIQKIDPPALKTGEQLTQITINQNSLLAAVLLFLYENFQMCLLVFIYFTRIINKLPHTLSTRNINYFALESTWTWSTIT